MANDTAGYQPTPFADSLWAHMEKWCADTGNPRRWAKWTDGVYGDYRDLAENAERTDSVRLHDRVTGILSSQAFAFNLFLPFREGNRERLSEKVSEVVKAKLTIDKVQFEWIPRGGLLCEIDGEWPVGKEKATAVDVVLWGRLENGRRCVVLVEVKLSERGFTSCGWYNSERDYPREVCKEPGRLFAEPSACYLIRSGGIQRERRYWEIFAKSYGSVASAFPKADRNGPCPFMHDMNQPMRNLAIALALEQEDTVQKAWYVLCAHDGNPDVDAHWKAWQNLLPDADMAPVLPASSVVAAGEAEGLTDWADYMRKRYWLKEVTS